MGQGRRRAAQPRREGWWREPPAWAWILMILGAAAIAVLTPLAAGRGQLSPSEAEGLNDLTSRERSTSGSGATSSAGPAATTAPTTRVVAIGDRDTFTEGGTGDAGWADLLPKRIPDIEVDTVAARGAGYVTPDPGTGQTFAELAGSAPVEDAAAVIVFGSRNDGPGVADQVADAASAVFASIRSRAPDAELIVLGPPWPTATAPAGLRNNRDVISAAAEAAGATFVDPLVEGWFVDQPGLIGDDGVQLADAGHTFVADQIEPLLREALGF